MQRRQFLIFRSGSSAPGGINIRCAHPIILFLTVRVCVRACVCRPMQDKDVEMENKTGMMECEGISGTVRSVNNNTLCSISHCSLSFISSILSLTVSLSRMWGRVWHLMLGRDNKVEKLSPHLIHRRIWKPSAFFGFCFSKKKKMRNFACEFLVHYQCSSLQLPPSHQPIQACKAIQAGQRKTRNWAADRRQASMQKQPGSMEEDNACLGVDNRSKTGEWRCDFLDSGVGWRWSKSH